MVLLQSQILHFKGAFSSFAFSNSKVVDQSTLKSNTYLHTPVFGDIQFCDVSLDEGSVAMVTIVQPVPLHEAFHEVYGRHMAGLGQQVAGETTGEIQ